MLITDLAKIHRITSEQEDQNVRFRQFVKYHLSWSEPRLDAFVLERLAAIEAQIDCTACGNCCRVYEISLTDEDLERLSEHLRLSSAAVEDAYAKTGNDCDRAFAASPCVFLEGNRCSVYPARPRDCREFPHVQKGEFRSRMWQVLSFAEDCPIIFNLLQQLKTDLRSAGWRG